MSIAARLTPGGCVDCGAEIVNAAKNGPLRKRCDRHQTDHRKRTHYAAELARYVHVDVPVSADVATASVSTATVAETAWLAGLWDGEGSVGVTFDRTSGRMILIPQIQMSHTHLPTVEQAIEVFGKIGVHAIHHTVQEKARHHKDSYHVGFGRTVLVVLAADALLPYAVTKIEQWTLVRELCLLRIERQGVTAKGNLRRGGGPGRLKPYTAREIEIAEQLRALNYRAKPGERAA